LPDHLFWPCSCGKQESWWGACSRKWARNHAFAGRQVHEREALRHLVVNLHKQHPKASQRDLARKAECSRGVVQKALAKLKRGVPLEDAPKSGRPRVLQEKALDRAIELGVEMPVGSSRTVSEQLVREGLPVVHPSTVCRAYRREGVKYGSAKRGFMISEGSRLARLAFASTHGDGKTDFRGVMFTDSKIFVLDKAGGKIWYVGGERPTSALPKSSLKVHVYYGVTFYGPTEPVFVTGGGSQKSKVVNPKTKVLLRGVGALEYCTDVLPSLIKDGDRLFSGTRAYAKNWVFQQDNAPAHTSKMSKAVLEDRMKGRWVQDWPPSSPDLSWIENVWAWADARVRAERGSIRTVEEFRGAIEKVFRELPIEHCQNYVAGMQKRLSLVHERDGRAIGR
jgi:transposase